MKQYHVLDHGFVSDGKTCNAAAMSRLLAHIKEEAEIVFPAGSFYFCEAVRVEGHKRLTISGSAGTTILLHYDPCGDYKKNSGFLVCVGCTDLVIRGLTIRASGVTGWMGTVTAINREERYYEAKIDDIFAVTGLEHPAAVNSCDEEETPDYALSGVVESGEVPILIDGKKYTRLSGMAYEVIGDHLIRVPIPEWQGTHRLRVGHRLLYRMSYYSPPVFYFSHTVNALLEDIEMPHIGEMGVIIGARSANFTFRRFNIRVEKDEPYRFAANKDGIHICGLMGYLHVYDCHFSGLGDDALNIHSAAAGISEILDDGRVRLSHRVNSGERPLPVDWAEPGDLLEVYDPTTLACKAKLRVGEKEGDVFRFTEIKGRFEKGDVLANTAYYAATHVSGCTVRNTRARAFLFQTRNVLMENCHLYGLSLPGVIVSPDIRYWYEVGPSENVVIRHNVFEKCCLFPYMANAGAIVMKASHDGAMGDYPAGVHRNVQIYGNTFRHIGNSAIYLTAAAGGEIYDNLFEDCCYLQNQEHLFMRRDVALQNCERITMWDNKTSQDEKDLYYTKGCKNIKKT